MYSEQVKKVANYYKDKSKRELRQHSFYQQIVNETNFLPDKSSIGHRFWYVLNNTKNNPKCIGDNCTNDVKWGKAILNYRCYCSTKCVANSKIVRNKYKQTNLDRYGVENAMQSKEVKEKNNQTNLRNHNGSHSSKTKEVRDKYKQTNLNRLGVEYPLQSKEVRDKTRQTNLTNRGVAYPMQSKEVKEKNNQTNLRNHNGSHSSQTKEIKEKSKQTNLKNHDGVHSSQTKEVRDKFKQTNLKNHDGKFACQQHLSEDTIEKVNNRDWLIDKHHGQGETLKKIAKELKIGRSSLGKHFKELKIEVLTFPTSEAEKEIFDYVRSIYPKKKEIQRSNCTVICPKQLDIYLPDMNLAIEFNGLRYHSTEQVGKGSPKPKEEPYHFNKYKLCFDQNIKLIHIFENEWELDKIDIMHWIEKYINQDQDFITKGLPISDLEDQEELDLSLNWPINTDKLKELGYRCTKVIDPVEQLLTVDNYSYYKIYDCGRVIYEI